MTERKKTICIVMNAHPSARMGGGQYQAQCVAEALAANGQFNIHYLASRVDPDYHPDGYTITKIERWRFRKDNYLFDTWPLLRLLRQIKPDVIYQRSLKAYTGVIAYYSRKTSCRSIFHIAADVNILPLPLKFRHLSDFGIRWIEKQMQVYGLKHVDCVIAQTRYQADMLFHKYGVQAAAVVPSFHPFPQEPIEKTKDSTRVVWIGNLRVIKRPKLFVRLARDLAYRNDLHFIMIGRPSDRPKLKSLPEEMKRLENLSYLGEIPLDEVNRQLAKAHILVNTSDSEGFPNTFIQAWMRRVPTVSINVSPDGILEAEGIGCLAGSYERLRDTVLALADDAARLEIMGQAAQNYAFRVHSTQAAEPLVRILDAGESVTTDVGSA